MSQNGGSTDAVNSQNEPSNEVLRSLLGAAFNHEELATLCFDRFPDLYEDINSWQHQKGIRELISYCRRRGRVSDLLEAVKERNPEQFRRFEPFLSGDFSKAAFGLARITVEIPNDKELIAGLLRNLAGILAINEGQIRAVRVEMGSLKLTLLLQAEAIGRLLGFYDAGDERLIELRIKDVTFVQPDLIWANLSRANLSEADLSEADLRRANLSGANLSEANLHGANLSEAALSGANLSRVNLTGAALSGAVVYEVNLTEADLSGASLRGADLRGANLRDAILYKANLIGADLRKADLSRASLTEAAMTDALLDKGSLDDSQLIWAQMSGAILLAEDFARVGSASVFAPQTPTSAPAPRPPAPAPRPMPNRPRSVNWVIIIWGILLLSMLLYLILSSQ